MFRGGSFTDGEQKKFKTVRNNIYSGEGGKVIGMTGVTMVKGLTVLTGVTGVALFDMPNLNRFDILSISIFYKIALSISIFFRIAISISISISIFSTSPYRYRYRYRYFSKVSIYRQSIFQIDILTRRIIKKTFFTGVH